MCGYKLNWQQIGKISRKYT